MGCFRSSKRDRGYGSGYSSANSSRPSAAFRSTAQPSGRSTAQPSGRSAVPVRFAPRPTPHCPPKPLLARPNVPDGPIVLKVFGKRVHRVKSKSADPLANPLEKDFSIIFKLEQSSIHTLSDLQACMRLHGADGVNEERMKRLLGYYWDIYFVDDDRGDSSNPRLWKLLIPHKDVVVQNGWREPPGYWFGEGDVAEGIHWKWSWFLPAR